MIKKNIRKFMYACLVISVVLGMCHFVPVKAVKKKGMVLQKRMTLTVGEKTSLRTKLRPIKIRKKVKWKTNAPRVVEVNKKGMLRAKSLGTARVTASVGRKKAACVVITRERTIDPAPTQVPDGIQEEPKNTQEVPKDMQEDPKNTQEEPKDEQDGSEDEKEGSEDEKDGSEDEKDGSEDKKDDMLAEAYFEAYKALYEREGGKSVTYIGIDSAYRSFECVNPEEVLEQMQSFCSDSGQTLLVGSRTELTEEGYITGATGEFPYYGTFHDGLYISVQETSAVSDRIVLQGHVFHAYLWERGYEITLRRQNGVWEMTEIKQTWIS